MRARMTREFYIPADSVEVKPEGIDAVAYYYDSGANKPAAMIFIGKQQKPAKHYCFKSVERRDEYVQEIFENVKANAEYKRERAAKAKAAKTEAANTIKVGDIFDTSWGYDQTNVEFFKVVAKKGQMIEVVEIGQVTMESKQNMDFVAPNPDHIIGKIMTKRINQYGGFKAHDCANASPYGGQPRYQTAWGYGH